MRKQIAAAGVVVLGVALWWRRNPSACPYSQRFWVEAPHPVITRARLREILEPKPRERVLEIGAGTGYYTLDLAEWVGPEGMVEIFDLQQEMLDHTLARAREEGVGNLAATQADAREMPYTDQSFDGAFLVTVLGEVPDQEAALRELRRVVKPAGRIVVGELFGDPHMVTHSALRERAATAGLRVERMLGGRLWHFTRLAPA